MITGLYDAASGMIAMESRQAVIANNIANAATPGFKSQAPVQLGFYEVFSEKVRRPFVYNREAAPAGGVKTVETFTNTAAGMFRQTDNPLNVALQGPGYFVVTTPQGERYSRSGDFSVNTEGQLVTSEGLKVQGIDGSPIDVRGEVVNIAQDGQVMVDGVVAGQLQLVEFESPERLLREGQNLYRASEEVAEKSARAVNTQVHQGNLEMSNVNLPEQMIQLTLGMRAYEANQRVIQAVDGTVGRLIESVGMPS